MLKRLSAGGFMRPVGQGARLESTIYVGGLVPLDAANGLDRAAPGEAARVDVHESSWTSSAVSVVEPTTLGTGCRCFELGENVDLRRRCTSNPLVPIHCQASTSDHIRLAARGSLDSQSMDQRRKPTSEPLPTDDSSTASKGLVDPGKQLGGRSRVRLRHASSVAAAFGNWQRGRVYTGAPTRGYSRVTCRASLSALQRVAG